MKNLQNKGQNFSVSFLDAERIKCIVKMEITFRNKYKEFSMCADRAGHYGQCQSQIKPANEAQKELLKLDKHHLKTVGKIKGLEKQIEKIIADIQAEEAKRKGARLQDLSDKALLAIIEDQTTFSDRDAELCAAFVKMFDLCEDDLQDITIDGNRCTVQGTDYLAGDDSEMDDEHEQNIENYIDECIIGAQPKGSNSTLERYFDREAFIRDEKMNGRGHALNGYDGGEESAEINGTTYYAYQN